MTPDTVRLPDGRVWLRLAKPDWADPLDPSHAQQNGGRWNPPGSFATLYLNGDVATARMQIQRMLAGYPVRIEDLDDGAYVLVAATLPGSQTCAEATSPSGLEVLGLPDSYPPTLTGESVPQEECRQVGRRIHAQGLRGVWCRSACTADGRGRELAWFPATIRSRARAVWADPLPLGSWRDAEGWTDLGVSEQADPHG